MTDQSSILLCDDDRLVLATNTMLLESSGYTVFPVETGDEAIRIARENKPTLAILDVRMQAMDGLEVARYLRDYVGTPFLFLSAFNDHQTLAAVRALGAQDYLVKPIDEAVFLGSIQHTLQRLTNLRYQKPEDWVDFASQPLTAHCAQSQPAAKEALQLDPLALAVGVLMARFDTNQAEALQQLHDMARIQNISVQQVVNRLIVPSALSLHSTP
jgi:two-component system, response regulator PdtaR